MEEAFDVTSRNPESDIAYLFRRVFACHVHLSIVLSLHPALYDWQSSSYMLLRILSIRYFMNDRRNMEL